MRGERGNRSVFSGESNWEEKKAGGNWEMGRVGSIRKVSGWVM